MITFMRKGFLGGAMLLAFTACSQSEVPDASSATLDTDVKASEVAFETPSFSEMDRRGPVAAYVMAHGAESSKISPDGSFVVIASSESGERQLYVGPKDGTDFKQITNGAGVSFFDILPSGNILYGSDNDGDERENYFLYNRSDNVSTLILPATEKGFRAYGGVSGDGMTIAFASTERNGLDFDIYVMRLASGKPERVYDGKYGNFVQAVNEDATQLILSETVGEDSDKLFVLDVSTGARRQLADPTPRANHSDAGVFFVDEDTLRLGTNSGREYLALSDMNLATGAMKTVYETNAEIDQIEMCGEQTVFLVNKDGFSELYLLGNGTPIRQTGLPSGVYDLHCNAEEAVIGVSGPDRAGDVFLFNFESGNQTRIYESDMGTLDPSSLIKPTSERMNARDGIELQGLLYMPQDASADVKPPVVFMVHGGPTAQARPRYSPTAQYLLSRGIAVFQTNVRGSTGFGRTYTRLDDRRKRLDSVRDLVDMLGGLKADGRVDTERAAVMGGSYGGYAVNAVLSEYPEAFIAGVSLFGVADWVTALEIASPALKAADLIEYGNIEDPEWREFYAKESPIRNADKIRVPVLFSHGAMDPRIDIAETETMVKALRANGIDAPFIRFPDEGHGWRKLDNRLYYQRRQAEFLEEVFGSK